VPSRAKRLIAGVLSLTAIVLTFLLLKPLPSTPGAEAESKGNRLESLAAQVDSKQVTITVSATLLNQLMEEDLAGHAPILERIRSVKGDDAAAKAEATLRAPYRARLRELTEAGVSEVNQSVRVITVGDRLSFSSVSFDGALKPKDPVSLLFFDAARADSVYRQLTTCDGQACNSAFKDQDGLTDARGLRQCSAQTQWVLMASGESQLQWRRSMRGVEDANGACAFGVRDHMRLFQELNDDKYGSWLVATPHRENWESGGHVIKSWAAANQAILDAWSRQASWSVQTTSAGWVRCYVPTDGLYQGVEFDGKTAIIDVR
jgi:hypothetical protein